jgi:hypothetical protein
MENQKTAIEYIDTAIDHAAMLLSSRTCSADIQQLGQAMEMLYRLRVEEQGRIKKRAIA